MDIIPCGSRPSRPAPEHAFTGTVWQDPIIVTDKPGMLSSNYVVFLPGARTAWHTHPMGQTLYVTHGTGRVQSWGGEIKEIRAGDTIWIPAGEKHWHGAGPGTMMCHISMQEGEDGHVVDWLEKVTDEEYAKA